MSVTSRKLRFNKDVYKAYGFETLVKEAEDKGVAVADEAPAQEDQEGDPEAKEDEAGAVDELAGAFGDADQPQEPTVDAETEAQDAAEEMRKEAEKEQERELHGKVSNILSDISDRVAAETLSYYQVVSARALEYLESLETPVEETIALLKQMPEVGIKILDAAAKSNFIDRDNICFTAMMEASVELVQQLEDREVEATLDLMQSEDDEIGEEEGEEEEESDSEEDEEKDED